MSATTTSGSADAPDSAPTVAPAISLGLRASIRRRRTWIVIAGVLLAGALLLVAVQGVIRSPGTPLGAEDASPTGARALARVLSGHGVEVVPVRTLDAALRAAADGSTVFLSDDLGVLDRRRVAELAAAADLLVVARPDFTALEVLAPGVRLGGAADGPPAAASCELPAAVRAGSISDEQRVLTIDDDAAAAGFSGCFPAGDGFAVVAGTSPSGGEVVLVAATTPFANGTIDIAGNAALAIGLLGQRDRVAWYLPGPGDADAADAPTLAELTPGWTSPVLVLLALVTIAAGIWRGRRFGPLVVEDLPVDVPAAETGQGRARLYARGSARLRSIDQLRFGTIRRLAALLRMPRSADVDAVVAGTARATGRPAASVREVLVDAVPDGDGDLVRLARELDDLEQAVRRALEPHPASGSPDPTGRRP